MICNKNNRFLQFQLDQQFCFIINMTTYSLLFTLILIVTTYSRTSIINFPFTGTIPQNSNGLQFQYDISHISPGTDIYIHFKVTNTTMLTSTFLAVSSIQYKFKSGNMTISYFYDKNHTSFEGNLDLTSMQLGKQQWINRQKQAGQNKLYFTIYNLDPTFRRVDVGYEILFTPSPSIGYNPQCFSCNTGVRKYLDSCVCKNCAPGYYGADCSINMLTLTSGQTTTANIVGPGMAFFLLQQASEVGILVKQTVGKGQAYFQFVQFQGQFASYTNVAEGKDTQGRFNLLAGTLGTPISAISSGTAMSITIAVYDSITTNIQISYSVPQKSNILVIVLGVLGGVLFIGLVIAAIYIVRNSRYFNNSREVRPVRQANETLSQQQLQRFFPTVQYKKSNENNSMQSINQDMKKQVSQDCVICLCALQIGEQIKVTYCKHIFHAHCLVGWFQKNQNCPYCREQFNRSNTIKLYKKIKQMYQGNILKGEDLVHSIMTSKIASKQSLQNLNEKQTQQIKINGTRNSFQVQEMNS